METKTIHLSTILPPVLLLWKILNHVLRLVHHPIERLHFQLLLQLFTDELPHLRVVRIQPTFFVARQQRPVDQLRLERNQSDILERQELLSTRMYLLRIIHLHHILQLHSKVVSFVIGRFVGEEVTLLECIPVLCCVCNVNRS